MATKINITYTNLHQAEVNQGPCGSAQETAATSSAKRSCRENLESPDVINMLSTREQKYQEQVINNKTRPHAYAAHHMQATSDEIHRNWRNVGIKDLSCSTLTRTQQAFSTDETYIQYGKNIIYFNVKHFADLGPTLRPPPT